MLASMFGFSRGTGIEQNVALNFNTSVGLAMLFGILGSTPLFSRFMNPQANEPGNGDVKTDTRIVRVESVGRFLILVIILFLCAMQLASETYTPFVYFRF